MATATSKLQVIIDIVTGQSSKNVSGLEASIQNLASGLTFALGTITAFGVAAKKAFELGKEGAEIQLTAERFERLAESIGTTGEALMNDLGPAMGNMLSDAEMMKAATDLMALGLVKTHDEAVRLASVAGQLGMNMNQLVLTLTNETTMRFDALGVSVDGFDEKVQHLEETGLSASEAFQEAFLQQAEEQLKRVGSAADTAAGEFAQMEAEFKNFSDTAKVLAMEALLPIVEGFNDATEYANLLDEALAKGVITADEHGEALLKLEFNSVNAAKATEELAKQMEQAAFDTEGADQAMVGLADSTDLVKDKYLLFGDAAQQYEQAQEQAAEAALKGADAQNQLAVATQSALDAMQDYMGIFDETEPAAEADAITEASVDHLIAQAEAAAAAGQSIEPYLEAIRAIDPATADALQESQAFSDTLAILDGLLADGSITSQQYADAIVGMTDAIEAGVDPVVAMQNQLEILGAKMGDASGMASSLKSYLDDLVAGSPYNVVVNTTYNQTGSPPDTGGGDTSLPPGSFAGGGNVLAGGSYLVGEQGPELFVPYTHGEILTNNEISGMGGSTVNIYQNNDIKNLNPLVAAMNQAYIDSSLVNEFRRQL